MPSKKNKDNDVVEYTVTVKFRGHRDSICDHVFPYFENAVEKLQGDENIGDHPPATIEVDRQ